MSTFPAAPLEFVILPLSARPRPHGRTIYSRA
jgi:hypothetical protein